MTVIMNIIIPGGMATHTNMDAKRDVEFEVPVDANLKCTEFKPFVFKGPC